MCGHPYFRDAVDVGDTCTKGQVQAMPSLCGRKNNPVVTSSLPVWIKHGLDPPSRLLVCPLQPYDAVIQCKKELSYKDRKTWWGWEGK